MVRTFGLTHLALAVADLDRSLAFYSGVFGVEEYYRDGEMVQFKTPGCQDVVALVLKPDRAGQVTGIEHFGFRLVDPNDIDQAVTEAVAAGGTLLRQGEFAPGVPYAFVADPDGYEVEIWYEP